MTTDRAPLIDQDRRDLAAALDDGHLPSDQQIEALYRIFARWHRAEHEPGDNHQRPREKPHV